MVAWEEGRKNQPLFIPPPPPYPRLPLYFVAHSHHPFQLNDYSADWCLSINMRRRERRRIENGCCSIQCSTTRYYFPGLIFLIRIPVLKAFPGFLVHQMTFHRNYGDTNVQEGGLWWFRELRRVVKDLRRTVNIQGVRSQHAGNRIPLFLSHSIANVLVTFTTHIQLNVN